MPRSNSRFKIAVVGSGIAGLACAYRLAQAQFEVSLIEANDYFGGHTHTVDVCLEGTNYGVDTGFLVYNQQTYPNLVGLFHELEIETAATEMTFSVKLPCQQRVLEWSGTSLNTVFAQRRNLFNLKFIGMLWEILRFNKQATALARLTEITTTLSLGEYLRQNHYSDEFCNWYLLPMAGCIWSCPTEQMLAFPLATFVRFCNNHSLLQISDRPQWLTVKGGARQYVAKLIERIPNKYLNTAVTSIQRLQIEHETKIRLESTQGSWIFDQVVLACHSDQSLPILADASTEEQRILAALRYHTNKAVLHTDSTCLPQNKALWSAWNYQSSGGPAAEVCVHYLINKLQPLPFQAPVIVSLNPLQPPNPDKVIQSFDYAHPVLDDLAIAAQNDLPSIQGQSGTWFAGAWTGYGFHEDGLKSGLAVAQAIIEQSKKNAGQ